MKIETVVNRKNFAFMLTASLYNFILRQQVALDQTEN